jgi:hypothetical protein
MMKKVWRRCDGRVTARALTPTLSRERERE